MTRRQPLRSSSKGSVGESPAARPLDPPAAAPLGLEKRTPRPRTSKGTSAGTRGHDIPGYYLG
jgi:hypothetical protein